MTGMSERHWDPVHEAAAQWLVRLEDSQVPLEEVAEWQRWVKADPRNAAVFRRMEEAWAIVGNASAEKMEKRPRTRVWMSLAAAAGIAAMAVGSFALRETGTSVKAISTVVGENRNLRLADGSEIALGGDSALEVSFDAHSRTIEILRGEALFSVGKDPTRPFRVQAGNARVTALGTRFNVRRSENRTVVAVIEGKVVVEPEHAFWQRKAGQESLRLAAGEQTMVDRTGIGRAMSLRDPANTTAWRRGLLSFQQEPLRYVLEDVNRYATKPIEIGDDAVGDIRITGTVMNDNVPEWIDSLESAFGLRAREEPSKIILTRSR